jgi:hypothetical protein
MSVVRRAAHAAARAARVTARLAVRGLRLVALLLLFVVALFMPVPILGRPSYEPPGRRNQPAEVTKRKG